MKTAFLQTLAVFAAAAIAQNLSAIDNLPACGQTCVSNMLAQSSSLGCAEGAANIACLCSNVDFSYGIHDCASESCPEGDVATVISYGDALCSSAGTATGTASIVATSGVTETGTSTANSSQGHSIGISAITTEDVLSTVTSGGSTFTTTIGSTTLYTTTTGSLASALSSTKSALSTAKSAASSVKSAASSSVSSAASATSSATSAASSAASSTSASSTTSQNAAPTNFIAAGAMSLAGFAALALL